MDLADDRFDVRHDPSRVDATTLLETVRRLGYTPEVVTREPERRALERVDLAALPFDLQVLFARARAARTLLLLDFSAPG